MRVNGVLPASPSQLALSTEGRREGGEGAAKLFLKGEKGKERGRLFRESAISRRRRRREIRRGMGKNPDLFRRKIVGFRTIFPPFSPASREEGNFARETQREKSPSFSPPFHESDLSPPFLPPFLSPSTPTTHFLENRTNEQRGNSSSSSSFLPHQQAEQKRTLPSALIVSSFSFLENRKLGRVGSGVRASSDLPTLIIAFGLFGSNVGAKSRQSGMNIRRRLLGCRGIFFPTLAFSGAGAKAANYSSHPLL